MRRTKIRERKRDKKLHARKAREYPTEVVPRDKEISESSERGEIFVPTKIILLILALFECPQNRHNLIPRDLLRQVACICIVRSIVAIIPTDTFANDYKLRKKRYNGERNFN